MNLRLVHTILLPHHTILHRHLLDEAAATRPRIPRMLTQEQPSCTPLRLVHPEAKISSTRLLYLTSLNLAVARVSSINLLKAQHIGEPINNTGSPPRASRSSSSVRGVSWSEVATVPKRKSHRGLDLDLSLNSEVNIRKGWKEKGGTK